MDAYKHCVSMRIERREIVEVHDDYVVVREHLTPDPRGPYLVMSNYGEPEWATREAVEPRPDCPHKTDAPLDAPPDPDCHWCSSQRREKGQE